jgi:hypothetical protein
MEVTPDGRPARLELATAMGLLTLHPEPAGLLNGNAVTDEGVRHLTLAWSDDHELEVEPLAISAAVTARRLAGLVAVGEGTMVPVVAVGDTFAIHEATRRYERLDAVTWRITGDGATRTLTLDDRGLPVWASPAGESARPGEWPLELDQHD